MTVPSGRVSVSKSAGLAAAKARQSGMRQLKVGVENALQARAVGSQYVDRKGKVAGNLTSKAR
jgi:hypothetical protein